MGKTILDSVVEALCAGGIPAQLAYPGAKQPVTEKLEEWMQGRHDMATDIGTVVEAREAVEAGLVDQMGTFHSAMAWLKGEIESKKAR